jgi:hypothetical protein
MRTITIEIPEPGDEEQCFDVVDAHGQRAGGLIFDEMLGQVVAMAHPKLGGIPRYRMLTAEQRRHEEQRRKDNAAELRAAERAAVRNWLRAGF